MAVFFNLKCAYGTEVKSVKVLIFECNVGSIRLTAAS